MLGGVRFFLRRLVPFEIRLRLAVWLRALRDWAAGTRFASRHVTSDAFANPVCSYELPFIDYPGQELVSQAERHNQVVMASVLNGLLIAPGEVFSMWRLAGRPTAARGYQPAAAFKNREVTIEVGGSVCLLSTVLYNFGLLGALEIVERHCHSVDMYGVDRYFELGRDAAIEYGYLDLRLRNPHPFPLSLTVKVNERGVVGALHAPVRPDFRVEIEVDRPVVLEPLWKMLPAPDGVGRILQIGREGLEVSGRRRVIREAGTESEVLPDTLHHPIPTLVDLSRNNL